MPPPLPEELVEEVLLRFPPEEPASLVCAALVCKQWCRLISDPGFGRRFREFHRRPPMLGFLTNMFGRIHRTQFVATTAFCNPHVEFWEARVLDARHGLVLFAMKDHSVFGVYDPTTDEGWEFSFPEKRSSYSWGSWTAAILCSAAGACDHLHCHHGPFQVVFVCTKDGNTVIYTYSSDAAAWKEPVIGQGYVFTSSMGSALVGNAFYFCFHNNEMGNKILKFNFELRQISMIQLPSSLSMRSLPKSRLITTADGGLGFVYIDDSKLYMWSRKDTHDVDAIWERRVTIDLNTMFPVDVDVTKLCVIGSGVDIIFIMFRRTACEVCTIDLKTYKVKELYNAPTHFHIVVPYMSFYTPALEVACSAKEPSARGSNA